MRSATDLGKNLRTNLFSADKIAVLGIGSSLRADDSAGMLVAKAISEKTKRSKKLSKCVKIFLGDTAPENLTGEIKRYEPSHLVLIDSCDLGKKPGSISIINPDLVAGVSFSTHQLPLKILIDYIQHSISCKVLIIGIQPKTLQYEKPLSKEVLKAVKELSTALFESIRSVI